MFERDRDGERERERERAPVLKKFGEKNSGTEIVIFEKKSISKLDLCRDEKKLKFPVSYFDSKKFG